jgi:small-conductance mechanosensitive channel
VYFNEFHRDLSNIMAIFWYHPSNYWASMAMSERVNKQILKEFEHNGIELALPSRTEFFSREDTDNESPVK